MFIPHEFDEAQKAQRKRKIDTAKRTAQKLNVRISHFVTDITSNPSFNATAQKQILDELWKNIKSGNTTSKK
jgi:hypothetical protein